MEVSGKKRYVVLIAGMLIQLCAGIIYMWSVFKAPVATHLSWAVDQAALTSSIMLASFVIGILLGGKIQDRTNPKYVAITGSVMISAGIILTAFVGSGAPWLTYITYGIIGGLGVGTVYTTTVSVIQKWFPDKRGFATGMTVGAFGFSLVIFSPVCSAMLNSLGVPATFIILGCIFLVVCVVSSLFVSVPPEGYFPEGSVPKPGPVSTKKQFGTKEMLKTRQFYMIALSMFFVLPAYFMLNPQLTTLGVERGLTSDVALIGVMITGIASATGRIVVSWVSDKLGRKMALAGIILITMVAILILIFAQGILFLVCIAAIAFSFGGSAGVYAAVTADNFGTKNMGANYGCVMVAFGVSALVFQLISAALSKGGDYTTSFIIAGATCVAALILVLLLRKPKES